MTVTIATDRRPRHQRNRYRFDRLMRYKAAMHRRIEADGWRWRAIEMEVERACT